MGWSQYEYLMTKKKELRGIVKKLITRLDISCERNQLLKIYQNKMLRLFPLRVALSSLAAKVNDTSMQWYQFDDSNFVK